MIDSRAHLNDAKFTDDLPEVIKRSKENGVQAIINVGYDLPSSKLAIELAEKWSNLYAVVGLHPHDAKLWSDSFKAQIIEFSQHEKVLAIGETGLDYHYDHSPRSVQQDVFRAHLRLAQELNLPVVVHTREAAQDTLDIIQEFPDVACLLHCYTGSYEMAEEYIKLGHCFSVGGVITFKNADRLRSVISRIPIERLLLETDCPYMTPVPYRGKRNEPALIGLVADKLAEIKGLSRADVEQITVQNTRKFFKIG